MFFHYPFFPKGKKISEKGNDFSSSVKQVVQMNCPTARSTIYILGYGWFPPGTEPHTPPISPWAPPCSHADNQGWPLSLYSSFIKDSQQEELPWDHVHPSSVCQHSLRSQHTLQHTQKALRGFSPSQPLLPQSRKRSMNCVYKSLCIFESRTRITFSSLAGR